MNGMAERGKTRGKAAMRWVHLVSNGWNGFGSDGREVDCAITFFINLANEDAEYGKIIIITGQCVISTWQSLTTIRTHIMSPLTR